MRPKINKNTGSFWFIDLDDTLHDASNGVLKNIDSNMTLAIQNLLGTDKKNANLIRMKYWQRYGATVAGLNKLHNISISEFLNNSHPAITLSDFVEGQAGAAARLKKINGTKWLVTNSPERYALSVLKHLKLNKSFDKVISVEKMMGPGGIKPKPLKFQWKRLIRLAGVPATEVVVVDDCLKNLQTAKLLGCRTIWAQCFKRKVLNTKRKGTTPLFVDRKINSLSGLLRV